MATYKNLPPAISTLFAEVERLGGTIELEQTNGDARLFRARFPDGSEETVTVMGTNRADWGMSGNVGLRRVVRAQIAKRHKR